MLKDRPYVDRGKSHALSLYFLISVHRNIGVIYNYGLRDITGQTNAILIINNIVWLYGPCCYIKPHKIPIFLIGLLCVTEFNLMIA
jgi:hypothetical protein